MKRDKKNENICKNSKSCNSSISDCSLNNYDTEVNSIELSYNINNMYSSNKETDKLIY